MTGKPVRLRELANRDDELQKAFARISTNSSIGSPRYAHELDLPDLRFKATPAIRTSCSTSSATITLKSGGSCMVSTTCPGDSDGRRMIASRSGCPPDDVSTPS